ncbi:hypothetical protein [Paenibacillus pabuli]|nr:hypothetical protein [Paenibacillus pabuli]UPK41123.1 hypothetical protein KET34_17505 [Paenibacillus pabuli]
MVLTNHSWIGLAGGLVALVLFSDRIRSAKEPFVLPSLFQNRRYLHFTLY